MNHFNEDHYNSHPEYLANEKINYNQISLTGLIEEKKEKQKAYAINPNQETISQMINSLK